MKLWILAHRNARQASQDIQREHLPDPRIRKSEGSRVQAGRKRVERDSDGFSGTDKKGQRLLGIGQGVLHLISV